MRLKSDSFGASLYWYSVPDQAGFIRQYKCGHTSASHSLAGWGYFKTGAPSEDVINNYWWAMIVRHPIDRLVSFKEGPAGKKNHRESGESWEEHFDWCIAHPRDHHVIPQHVFIDAVKTDRIFPDYVGHFEQWNEAWQIIHSRFRSAVPMKHYNKSEKRTHWREVWDSLRQDQRDSLLRLYEQDFERFGYGTP